jgi:hypothetical protein
LDNLLIAVPRVDLALIFDNSKPILENPRGAAYHLAALIENGRPNWFEPTPAWLMPLKASFEAERL